MNLQKMHDLLRIGENNSRDLPKVSKMAAMDNFNLPKVCKMT